MTRPVGGVTPHMLTSKSTIIYGATTSGIVTASYGLIAG